MKKKNCNRAKPKIICSTFKQKKKKPKKKIELKSEEKKKKKIETEPSPRQAQQSKPTHRFSKKKKKPTQNQKSNLPTVTSLQRIQRKQIPNILRQSIHITIYRAKAKQTKSNILCLLKKKKKPNIEPLYQNGKSKPKPQYSLLGRRNLPIVIVAVACPSSQITDRRR